MAETLLQLGIEVIGQEVFVPTAEGIGEGIRAMIDRCDAMILLVGKKFGASTSHTSGKSIVQLEYETAKQMRKPIFCFILAEEGLRDSSTDEFDQRQTAFVEQIRQSDLIYSRFRDASELRFLIHKIDLRPELKPQNLPFASLGSLFTGRDVFLQHFRTGLTGRHVGPGTVTARQVIHGLGGVGKTRLAIEYAYRYAHEYTALLFLTADSAAALRQSLADLCGPLILDIPEHHVREQEVQVAAAVRWLRQHPGWLLILDGVDTAEAEEAVESLIQRLPTGHIIVTSRRSSWFGAVSDHALDVLSSAEAQEYLLMRTAGKRKPTTSDEADAHALASELGNLPLALEQASAFVSKNRIGFAEYRSRFRAMETKILEWWSTPYPRSLSTFFQATIEQLGDDGRGLLNILCWLAPDPIPIALVAKLTARTDDVAIDTETGLADLAEYSLLRWSETDREVVTVHRIVQDIARYRLPESERRGWLIRALRMLDDFCDGDPRDVRTWENLYSPVQPHLSAILAYVDQFGVADQTAHLFGALALYLQEKAEFGLAEPLMRRALAINEASYGTDHPRTAVALNNLAQLLEATNRLAEAEPLIRRAIAINEASFGPDHPQTAVALNNLAQLLQATNRLAEAEPLIRRAIAINEASFGPDHPQTAVALNNLAQLLQATNRLAEAEPLIRRAIAINEASFGPDHPQTAVALNNLAQLLQATNRLAEAEPLIRRALAIDERAFGADHPNVARDLTTLAELLRDTKRLAEAEPLIRRAIAINEASFGTEHPQTAVALSNLAQLLQATNRLAEAESLIRRAISILRQFGEATGYEHPWMQATINNYRNLLLSEGMREEEVKRRLHSM